MLALNYQILWSFCTGQAGQWLSKLCECACGTSPQHALKGWMGAFVEKVDEVSIVADIPQFLSLGSLYNCIFLHRHFTGFLGKLVRSFIWQLILLSVMECQCANCVPKTARRSCTQHVSRFVQGYQYGLILHIDWFVLYN